MSFSNMFIRSDQPFDHGLYWGIRLLFAETTWKVDLWGCGREAYKQHMDYFERVRRQLQDVDRLAILRIKSEVCQRPQYRSEITSGDVYEAVATNGISTVQEFDEWLSRRDNLRDT